MPHGLKYFQIMFNTANIDNYEIICGQKNLTSGLVSTLGEVWSTSIPSGFDPVGIKYMITKFRYAFCVFKGVTSDQLH